jgi:hypothetical protein
MKRVAIGALVLAMLWHPVARADQQISPALPKWHMLTSLPLFLGEGGVEDILKGLSPPSPLISRMQAGRTLVPIDTLSQATLAETKFVFLLQPTLVPPDELTAFDAWVRAGGRALILADPDMLWPTKSHYGGSGMPPPSTLLDPLFRYWGLELEGLRQNPRLSFGEIFGERVALVNPGKWTAAKAQRSCQIESGGLIAQCDLGKGKVILVADADIADPRLWADSKIDNLPILAKLLSRLES